MSTDKQITVTAVLDCSHVFHIKEPNQLCVFFLQLVKYFDKDTLKKPYPLKKTFHK